MIEEKKERRRNGVASTWLGAGWMTLQIARFYCPVAMIVWRNSYM